MDKLLTCLQKCGIVKHPGVLIPDRKVHIYRIKTKFYIEKPCTQDISQMTVCGKNFYCTVCDKQVFDLSASSLAETEEFAAKNKFSCVILHKRHVRTAGWFYRCVNSVEIRLWNLGLKKTAVICTAILLTTSGCYSKRKRQQVTMGFFRSEYNKEVPYQGNETVPTKSINH